MVKKHKTHSKSENRKPIQARGPPANVIRFDQIPGTDWATSGILVQRSGLQKSRLDHRSEEKKERDETNLNSVESSPHINLSRFMGEIGMNIV